MDPETREYLRQLAKTLDLAEEICQCAHCTKERMKEEMTQCEMNKRIQALPRKIFTDPNGFTTELGSDPTYWKS